MSAVVRGATMTMIPIPKTMLPGRKSVKYEAGGTYVLRWFGSSLQGVLDAGTRGRRDHARRDRDEADGITPRALLAIDRAEGEPSHRDGHDPRSYPVEGRGGVLVAALLDVIPGRPCRERDQRHVDEECGAPR